MLVVQYRETDCRYTFILVNCQHFKGRIELIISFEMLPVLLKLLGGWRTGDLGWNNIASTCQHTASQTLDCVKFTNLNPLPSGRRTDWPYTHLNDKCSKKA
jgi:hypothetical protein